jgi:NAD(P)-dependent dehydrogenase (short-subunit alcohol dehydrogenase family)
MATVLITGATEGLGLASAKALAGRGHALILHGRDPAKLEAARASVLAGVPSAPIALERADFADLAQVRALAGRLKGRAIDVVLNNAAAMFGERVETRDGFEAHFGVNHLAPALLTFELLPELRQRPGSRVVFVSSVGYKSAQPDFDDLQSARRYAMQRAYFNSKLYNLWLALALAERLGPGGTTVNAAHPGGVKTGLARDFRGPMKAVFAVMMPLFFVSPERGARTQVFLCDDPSVAKVTGRYFVNSAPEALAPCGADRARRERLYAHTLELLGHADP